MTSAATFSPDILIVSSSCFLVFSISLRFYGEHQGTLDALKLKQSSVMANNGSVIHRSVGKENSIIIILLSSSRDSHLGYFFCRYAVTGNVSLTIFLNQLSLVNYPSNIHFMNVFVSVTWEDSLSLLQTIKQ